MVGDKAPAMSARFENYFTSKSLSIQIAAFIWKNLELEGWWIHWVIYLFIFSDSPSRVNNYVFWWGVRRGLRGKFSEISLLIAPGASDYPKRIYPQCGRTQVQSLGWEDPLEKRMALQSSSCLRFPWTEEPGRLQTTGSQRVKHNWVISKHTHIHTLSTFSSVRSRLWAWGTMFSGWHSYLMPYSKHQRDNRVLWHFLLSSYLRYPHPKLSISHRRT